MKPEKRTLEVFDSLTSHFYSLMDRGKSAEAWGICLTLLETSLVYANPTVRRAITNEINKIIDRVGKEMYEDPKDYLSSIGELDDDLS